MLVLYIIFRICLSIFQLNTPLVKPRNALAPGIIGRVLVGSPSAVVSDSRVNFAFPIYVTYVKYYGLYFG